MLVSLVGGAALAAPDDPVTVRFLGTGGPEITVERQGIATLMEAGGESYLFDTGRGVLQRLYETGVNPKRIARIFYTHLHNDHIEGLPNLWMTSWFLLGRTRPYDIWGPEGTAMMLDGMRKMYGFDVRHRANAFNDARVLINRVHEIEGESVVFETAGTRITAFPVEHGDGNPAYGYCFEYGSRKVVLSGDTTAHENLVRYAKNADLLIQNVIALPDALAAKPEMRGVLAKLTTVEQAARIFSRAQPRFAVYSHIVLKEMSGAQGVSFLESQTRAHGYKGPLLVAEDRMSITIDENIVTTPPPDLGSLPALDRKASYSE